MRLSHPTDAQEREADSIARLPGSAIARTPRLASPQRLSPAGLSASQALHPLQQAGQPLAAPVQERMEARFGTDLSRVRVHADAVAADSARALSARAYTAGDHIVFGAGEYAPSTASGEQLLTHEMAHVVQHSREPTPVIHRKEVKSAADLRGPQDWTTADREGNTDRWWQACLVNLNALDSGQYLRIVERRDFYKWFYAYTSSRGYATRWALAAYIVANGAHQIADMNAEALTDIGDGMLILSNVELQGAMREGNQDIFDNVLPKLKKLIDGGPLTGKAALKWDMQILAEEQAMVQPMYDRMAPETVERLSYIARKQRLAGAGAWITRADVVKYGPGVEKGRVPAFTGTSLLSVRERWEYGMGLGAHFTPGGTDYDPASDVMPPVSVSYTSGAELAKVDTRAALHELDAWLNPDRAVRIGPGSDINAIIGRLSATEKQLVLADQSPDGWAYSVQFGQFTFIPESLVRQALPAPATDQIRAATAVFLARFQDARRAARAAASSVESTTKRLQFIKLALSLGGCCLENLARGCGLPNPRLSRKAMAASRHSECDARAATCRPVSVEF
jgi:hypothetical protein